MITRPLPLPKSLPSEPMSDWSPGYLIALRERLRLHVAWITHGGTDDLDLDAICEPCDPDDLEDR